MFWIEHEHRISIGTPAAAEVAPSAVPACPETDDVPLGAECMAFIDGGGASDMRSPARAGGRAVAPLPGAQQPKLSRAPACPASNENGPYSANCITFLSGWYWHPDAIAP